MTGQRKALVIATDLYEDEKLGQLMAPTTDAVQLADVLGDERLGDFNVDTVINGASWEVMNAVEGLLGDCSSSDLVLLHFSCHGIKDERGELFLAARNTVPNRLVATAVDAAALNRMMQRSRAQSVILLLDCCYGGAFERGFVARSAGDVDVAGQFHAGTTDRGRGRVVITSCSALEYAFEGADLTMSGHRKPSLFTEAFVHGIKTGDADRDRDGVVMLNELYDYVHDRVRDRTPNQTPSKWAFGVQGDLRVAHNPHRATATATATATRPVVASPPVVEPIRVAPPPIVPPPPVVPPPLHPSPVVVDHPTDDIPLGRVRWLVASAFVLAGAAMLAWSLIAWTEDEPIRANGYLHEACGLSVLACLAVPVLLRDNRRRYVGVGLTMGAAAWGWVYWSRVLFNIPHGQGSVVDQLSFMADHVEAGSFVTANNMRRLASAVLLLAAVAILASGAARLRERRGLRHDVTALVGAGLVVLGGAWFLRAMSVSDSNPNPNKPPVVFVSVVMVALCLPAVLRSLNATQRAVARVGVTSFIVFFEGREVAVLLNPQLSAPTPHNALVGALIMLAGFWLSQLPYLVPASGGQPTKPRQPTGLVSPPAP